jgi:IMP dehydrogenase
MDGEIRLGLTFDDVLLEPKRSSVRSRKGVDTSSWLTPQIRLEVPILSANMDTVTEWAMAIAMARVGGIGIIHRFLPIEEQVRQVRFVKRAESLVIERPYTMGPDTPLGDAVRMMDENHITGLLVTDHENRLLGILTQRDIMFVEDDQVPIADLMTPVERVVTAPEMVSLEEAKKLFRLHKFEKYPIVSPEGRLKGLITIKDIKKFLDFPLATKDEKGQLRVGAAIGVKGDYLDRARELVKARVDVLVVDIAHGHSDNAVHAVKSIQQEIPETELIVGNVATAEGVRDLAELGVAAIKVGVGPGSICITRIVTGAGVPQLTAILDCAREARGTAVRIIADGGIRNSGDLAKALAAGASTVMLGNLLAGTDESPGMTLMRRGVKHKLCRGSASLGSVLGAQERSRLKPDPDDAAEVIPEGVEAIVPYRGAVAEVIHQLVGGLRSGISYCGAQSIPEMQRNASFIRVTAAGVKESGSHDVELLG